MTRAWTRFAATPLCLLLAGASLAHADAAATPPAEAKQAFSEAKAAYERGEFELALALFQRAQRIAPAPSLLYNIGMAYERLLRYEESARTFDLYLAEAPAPQSDAERTFQDNLRARATANHSRGQRPTLAPPPQPIEPPPVVQLPGYPYTPYAYYGYGYPQPRAVPVFTRQQRIDRAAHRRNAGIALTATGVGLVIIGAVCLDGAINADHSYSARIGLVYGGVFAELFGLPLAITGAVLWGTGQASLTQERRKPDDGAAARRAALDLAVPQVRAEGGAKQLVVSIPALRF